jgi:hypothetical protein
MLLLEERSQTSIRPFANTSDVTHVFPDVLRTQFGAACGMTIPPLSGKVLWASTFGSRKRSKFGKKTALSPCLIRHALPIVLLRSTMVGLSTDCVFGGRTIANQGPCRWVRIAGPVARAAPAAAGSGADPPKWPERGCPQDRAPWAEHIARLGAIASREPESGTTGRHVRRDAVSRMPPLLPSRAASATRASRSQWRLR